MIILSHPVGSTMVRQSLQALAESNLLNLFATTLGFSNTSVLFKLPGGSYLKAFFQKRLYELNPDQIKSNPTFECFRLMLQKLPQGNCFDLLKSIWNIDIVSTKHDQWVAKVLEKYSNTAQGIYAYEDSARDTFQMAKCLGMHCYYELPIAYWTFTHTILKEEAERLPEWKDTLIGNHDSAQKLERKTQELELADTILCPSIFVKNTLPQISDQSQKCLVIPYGAPVIKPHRLKHSEKIRFLFAGSLSQRKGLADFFSAIKLLKASKSAEWVVMGALLKPLSFYKYQCPDMVYEPPRSNAAVIELMLTCDVLVLPSLAEGRAIVQLEALACGLPLIITPNTGGEDLIETGVTGFIVPIRSPEMIAQKLQWFIDRRDELPRMSAACRQKASMVSWEEFRNKLVFDLKATL